MTTGKVLGEKYIINGEPADTADFNPDMTAGVYYEVVRLIDGKFLFLSGSGIPFRLQALNSRVIRSSGIT